MANDPTVYVASAVGRTKAKSRKAKSRIYWREQGGQRRAYADFRYMGSGREALIAPGELRATTDRVIAEKLMANRLSDLQGQKRDAALLGVKRKATLEAFVANHLVQKAKSGRFRRRGWRIRSECFVSQYSSSGRSVTLRQLALETSSPGLGILQRGRTAAAARLVVAPSGIT